MIRDVKVIINIINKISEGNVTTHN